MHGSPRSRSSEVASALLSITTTRGSPQANESSPDDGFLGTFEGLLLGGLHFAFGNEPFGAVVSPRVHARRRRLRLVTKAWQR
jgi:hypothetical protein